MNITTINNYIDCCIGSNGSHYDISLVIYEIIKDNYKYVGDNIWEYNNHGNWTIDIKNQQLKLDIKTIVINYFLDRSKFWTDKSNDESENQNVRFDSQLKSVKILQISNKLKDDKFIIQIIKEVKCLFYTFKK